MTQFENQSSNINPLNESDNHNSDEDRGFSTQGFENNETIDDDLELFRQLNKARQEYFREIISNDYSLNQIISYCNKVNFNQQKLSAIFYFNKQGGKVPLKKEEFIKTINYISELMEDNNNDFESLISLSNQSRKKDLLRQNLLSRTEEAVALMQKYNFCESFILGKLHKRLNEFNQLLLEYISPEVFIFEESILINLHQEKDSFLSYFNKLNNLRDSYLDIRNRIYSQHVNLIYKFSNKFRKLLSNEDAFQEGCIGFLRALEQYDLSSGICFSTCAVNNIKYAIQHAEKRDKVPLTNLFKEILRIESARKSYFRQYNKIPDNVELANYLNMTQKKLNFLLKCENDIRISSEYLKSGNSIDAFSSQYKQPSFDLMEEERMEKLNEFIDKLIDHLPEKVLQNFDNCSTDYRDFLLKMLDRNILIFKVFYGLIDENPTTLEELAISCGIKMPRVLQICQKFRDYLTDIVYKYNLDKEIKMYLESN